MATRHPRDGVQGQIVASGNDYKPPRSRSLARRISRRRLRHVPGGRYSGYDPERDAYIAEQPRRAKATTTQNSSRSRYAIDPETITAGRLPQRGPVVTSAANPHYQKHLDRLFDLAKAGDWDGGRTHEGKGRNSYSKMVARSRQDLLAVHAVTEAAP